MNKLKGSLGAVRMKHLFLIFAVAFCVALPLRAYQLIVSVDSATGFFIEGDVTVPILYGVVAVAVILFVVLSFLCKGIPKPEIPTGKNPLLGITSLFAAAGMFLDAVSVEHMLIPLVGDTQLILYNNLNDNSGIFYGLRFVFAIISIVWFVLSGISHFTGSNFYKRRALFALAPVGWSLASLISKLVESVSFIKVSELLFEVAFFVFASMFLFTFARISTGIFTENSMWGIFGYGLCAILFGGMITIPRLVVYFLGIPPVTGNEFSYAHLAVFMLICAAVFAATGYGFIGKKKELKRIEEVELPDDDEVVVKSNGNVSVVEDFGDDVTVDGVTVQAVSDTEITAAIESLLGKRLTVEIDENDVMDLFDEDEPVEEVAEEIIDEPVEEVTEEIIEEPVEEVTEEVIEEPVEEVAEEIIEELVEDAAEEVIEEPVEEVTEEVIEEPVEEAVEEIIDEAQNTETFVDFSEMLIDEDEVYPDENEATEEQNEVAAVEEKSEEQSSYVDTKKKEKKEKKKLFGKKVVAEEMTDESLKPVSLAELRRKKESE